jgi:maltooligosyltrehalose trehalohydrolase
MHQIHQRSLGVNIVDGMASVLVWAPFTKDVKLHNETTDETLSLISEPLGYWSLKTDKIKDKDLYRFILDDSKSLPDPASISQPNGVHASSQALNLDFNWTDNQWVNKPVGDYIVYELHVGTFSPKGNFDGVVERLDHLKELGITAIEIMPVAQCPGSRNWGYDGVFPYAVQNNYGGPIGLKQLVNTCHSKGFAVILDVVYNHLGPEGNCLPEYGPYFKQNCATPWGCGVNYDEAYCDPVRQYVIENALMWLRDFHFDALRLDAVHAIVDRSPKHIINEMNEAVAKLNAMLSSNKFLIIESDLNDVKYLKDKSRCGYGVAAQWNDEFHHALRVASGQVREGYFSDFNGVADLAKSMKNAFIFTGQYADHRHRNFGTDTAGISGDHFIVFDQNHDQIGNRMLGERLSSLISFEMQKLLPAVVLTSPFVPLLFMGEEWGATTPFLYFVNHSDQILLKAIAEGREREFIQFQQLGGPLPADSESTFLDSKLKWEERQTTTHALLFSYYKYLIHLRKTNPALMNYERSSVEVMCQEEKEIIILERSYKEQTIYCAFNFSKSKHELKWVKDLFPLHILLNSGDEKWGGNAEEYFHFDGSVNIEIQPESVIILANYNV